jgi:Ni/Co efflux regulator RcnB
MALSPCDHNKEETMGRRSILAVVFACSMIVAGGMARAEEPKAGAHPAAAPAKGEPHPAVKGYTRVAPPTGWDARPQTADKATYQHNYQAPRSFQIGPYHPPAGWTQHHWAYGQTLPRAYWAAAYILADYWLFGLEVPPVGYEWVRDGSDAILINTTNGEILQVEYGVFA